MNNLVEGKHGHGAKKKKLDLRDHKWTKIAGAGQPFDWIKGFDIEDKLGFKIPVEDQGQSSSCGGQALRYYLEVDEALRTGKMTRRSAKFSYSQIYYPGGGTESRAVGNFAVRFGTCKEELNPSYDHGNPPTELFMRARNFNTTANFDDAATDKESAYAYVKANNIDAVAEAIEANNGAILMINGQNNGTWLSQYPESPMKTEWRHFLYAGKARMINGKKYIVVLNSWGNDTGVYGWQWLPEEYFTSGNVNECLVLYDTAVYASPTPSKTLTWLQKLVDFFHNFNQVMWWK